MTATTSSTPSNPQPIRPLGVVTSLSDQVWERLRSDIIYGLLEPGQRIVELKVAAQMGTSQGPVREALARLESEGLVERQARSGTFVTAISYNEMYELFSVRSLVERFAIQRAMPNLTDDRIDELRRMVDLMRDAADRGQWGELVEYDMGFHLRICEWSGSHTLNQIWLPLYSQIQRFITQTHPLYFFDLHEIAEMHQPLIDALSMRDIELSGSRIEDHVMMIWTKIDAIEPVSSDST